MAREISVRGEWEVEFNEGAWLTFAATNAHKWLQDYADSVVTWARYFAPKRTGAGARSIHWEWDQSQMKMKIGPDQRHYYMIYQELGTRYIRPRPHLRPALAAAERGARSLSGGGYARPRSFPTAGVPLDAYYSG